MTLLYYVLRFCATLSTPTDTHSSVQQAVAPVHDAQIYLQIIYYLLFHVMMCGLLSVSTKFTAPKPKPK